MAITNLDGLINAMGNNSQVLAIYKQTMLNTVASQVFSKFTAVGYPAAGVAPTTATVLSGSNLLGAFQWTQPIGGNSTYVARMFQVSSISANDIQLHDRLAHMGGLSGISTGVQTVNVDISGSGNNLPLRRGGSDYSDVQWWLEWYTATGATSVNVTVTYTNAAGTSGRTVVLSAIGATIRQGRMIQIIGSGGEFIQSIQSIQLSASTLTQGDFGVTATRALCGNTLPQAGNGVIADWKRVGLARVHNEACLFITILCGSTTTGQLYGSIKLIQG